MLNLIFYTYNVDIFLKYMNTLYNNINKEMTKLKYTFKKPPILIGGGAMEFYNMRDTGHDYDFMISMEDFIALKCMGKKLNSFGGKIFDDDGLSIDMDNTFSEIDGLEIDLAVTMFQFKYDFFDHNTEKFGKYKVVSRENLLLMKALAASNNYGWDPKYKQAMIQKQRRDVDLILKSIVEHQYKKGEWDEAISFNTPIKEIKFKF